MKNETIEKIISEININETDTIEKLAHVSLQPLVVNQDETIDDLLKIKKNISKEQFEMLIHRIIRLAFEKETMLIDKLIRKLLERLK